ncbi:MAG TPA: deaminase [Aliiroseovarius sp.]|nr:deaminase [Aliiroseovarius sp.]
MQPIIYDVAVSADGFIAGPNNDVSQFPHQGAVVDDYTARLATYATCLMGRRTYEFGYAYGLQAGQNPYANMDSYVISGSIELPADSEVQVIRQKVRNAATDLRQTSAGPIYLCGGGALAGWMLRHGLIDILRLKRAPILLGQGVRLWGDEAADISAKLVDSRAYPDGIFFQEFRLDTA